jgi:uncharacterized membrane protein YdjX (TVP38/TMEM64 family)
MSTEKGVYGGQETTSRQVAAGVALFLVSVALLAYLILSLPPLSAKDRALVYIPPRSLQQMQDLARIGAKYSEEYPASVMVLVAVLYIFLQAFSIPGSIGLSFVSGALFGVTVGFPLVIACATIGPSISFGLSHLFGRAIVRRIFPSQMVWFAGQVDRRRRNLFNFLLFLRITPFLPNFFINLASPLLGVPLQTFVVATMF